MGSRCYILHNRTKTIVFLRIIHLCRSCNELDLNEKEIEALPCEELERRLETAYKRMYKAGAHYVVDGIWDCDKIIDEINGRLSHGEKP